MSAKTEARAPGADDLRARALHGLQSFGAALRDVWKGYWDRPIGC